MENLTDGPARFDQVYERMMALLSTSARGALLSTGLAEIRVQSLDLMVKSFAAETTAESLVNQLDQIALTLKSLGRGGDTLGDLSETESLRLQMAMDRLSKMTETLSNILKKIDDTAQSITQNLK